MSVKVSQVCEFECCYLIDKTLNAHRYKFEVTVECNQRSADNGYVIDFATLLDYMNWVVPKNTFLFDTTTNNIGRDVAFVMGQRGVSIQGVSFTLCAEGICSSISKALQDILDFREPGVTIVSARLRENNTSFVSWQPEHDDSL
jgi:6-pyruvoyl-tetrahydropterin synthase